MNNLIITNTKLPEVQTIEQMYTNTLTEQTRRSYVSTIKEFFNAESLNDINKEMIQAVTPYKANDWANDLLEKGKSPATINKKLSSMKNFYQFLCRRTIALMNYNPFSTDEGCIRFKNATKVYSNKRTLEPTEVHAIFESVKIPTDKTSRDYLLSMRDLIVLQILATTGLRRAEITGIKLGDIKVISGKFVIEVLGKGEKVRPMVLAKAIKKNIDLYIEARELSYSINPELPLITNHTTNGEQDAFVTEMTIYRIVKKYADLSGVGVDDIAPHNFRHTFCTQSLDNGLEIGLVADLMGHTSASTTKRYDHSRRVIHQSPSEVLSNMYGI